MRLEFFTGALTSLDVNTLTAWPALIMAALVAYAFGPRFSAALTGAPRAMARGICVFALFAALRLWFWDVAQHAWPEDARADARGGIAAQWFTAFCNLGWCWSFYMILGAIHMQIPEGERGRWWVVFAPFYPARSGLAARIFRGWGR